MRFARLFGGFLRGKTVLVTGGTGSLGSALIDKLLTGSAKKVICFSRDEHKQVEMKRNITDKRMRWFIGDVRDVQRLYRAFNGVDYIIHAAALKHVDTGETDPLEVIKTNIHGAENVIDAAIDCKVKKVLAISTDKAVNPINLYGAAKLCADGLFLGANNYSGRLGPKFSVIRPGNFWGSRGSVVPYFQSLKENGDDVLPVTDKEMTRFFITIPDAVDRVLEALETMQGGEIYCPKMRSYKIVDLAKEIHPTATLKEIGARKGEKLHEDLVLPSDRNVLEAENFYIIYPYKVSGRKVPKGFEYNSRGSYGVL